MKSAVIVTLAAALFVLQSAAQSVRTKVGTELAVPRHLYSGEELKLTLAALVDVGRKQFEANWTDQDGAGRPLSKGTGRVVSDSASPLKGARAFNRISGPDANSCQGCHNAPYGMSGGNGDFVTNTFQAAERFDFVTFDRADQRITAGTVDEAREPVSVQSVGNLRSTPGLFGAGYLEMIARQMTEDLHRARDSILPGQSKALASKGISFGTLARLADGRWDVSRVQGLPAPSIVAASPEGRPSLIVRPWSQSGGVVSLRELVSTEFNQHLGIQTTERFGANTDPDGDGVRNEMTRGDVTAVAVFLATLPVPGRVIPARPEIEDAVMTGERLFLQIGCAACHVPSLPLDRNGWMYSEPGPFNPPGTLRQGDARALRLDLTASSLPPPRLAATDGNRGVVRVPAYTDFKLHDITDAAEPSAKEPLDTNEPASSPKFRAGNRKFLTRRLWAVGNERPYFHDGRFTTIREAVLAHAGEAIESRHAFESLATGQRDAVIEFLKSLQVLPPGTTSRIVDEHGRPREWQGGR